MGRPWGPIDFLCTKNRSFNRVDLHERQPVGSTDELHRNHAPFLALHPSLQADQTPAVVESRDFQ